MVQNNGGFRTGDREPGFDFLDILVTFAGPCELDRLGGSEAFEHAMMAVTVVESSAFLQIGPRLGSHPRWEIEQSVEDLRRRRRDGLGDADVVAPDHGVLFDGPSSLLVLDDQCGRPPGIDFLLSQEVIGESLTSLCDSAFGIEVGKPRLERPARCLLSSVGGDFLIGGVVYLHCLSSASAILGRVPGAGLGKKRTQSKIMA